DGERSHRILNALEAGIVGAHAPPQVDAAVSRRRVEVACRIVDAHLLREREPATVGRDLVRGEGPLEQTVTRARSARDAVRRRRLAAGRAARRAGLAVRRAVVALLAA